ncbi:MAG: hypothetical protein ACTHMB_21125 [Candidatus Binatia bacterium]
MPKLSVILLSGTFTLLILALSALAQPRPGMMWRGSGGWGPGTAYNKMPAVRVNIWAGSFPNLKPTERRI